MHSLCFIYVSALYTTSQSHKNKKKITQTATVGHTFQKQSSDTQSERRAASNFLRWPLLPRIQAVTMKNVDLRSNLFYFIFILHPTHAALTSYVLVCLYDP